MTNSLRTPELLQKLQDILQPDEEVCWFASPNPAKKAIQMSVNALVSSWFVIRLFLLSCVLLTMFVMMSEIQDALFLQSFGIVLGLLLILMLLRVFLRVRIARQRVLHTIYAITTKRLIVLTRDRHHYTQNIYGPSDLGTINPIERLDGWGDIVIGGQQRIVRGYAVSPRIGGIEHVCEVATLLIQLKEEHHLDAPRSSETITS